MDEKQTFVERPFQSSNIASADGQKSTVAAAAQARNNQLLILNIILPPPPLRFKPYSCFAKYVGATWLRKPEVFGVVRRHHRLMSPRHFYRGYAQLWRNMRSNDLNCAFLSDSDFAPNFLKHSIGRRISPKQSM